MPNYSPEERNSKLGDMFQLAARSRIDGPSQVSFGYQHEDASVTVSPCNPFEYNSCRQIARKQKSLQLQSCCSKQAKRTFTVCAVAQTGLRKAN